MELAPKRVNKESFNGGPDLKLCHRVDFLQLCTLSFPV